MSVRALVGGIVTAALALSLAGCAGDSELVKATQRLDEVRSAELALDVRVDPRGGGEPFGYSLAGPVTFPEDEGGLPKAELEYTQERGDAAQDALLVLDGRSGYVEVNGERQQLSEQQLATMRTGTGSLLDGIDPAEWFDGDPSTSESGDGGTVYEGDADPAKTLAGLLRLAGGVGGEQAELDDEQAERLRATVERSQLRAVVGADDLLRALTYDVEVPLSANEAMRAALGGIEAAAMRIEFRLDRPQVG